MTAPRLILLASAGSFLLLAAAFAFQAAGYAPCKLCVWQRWPHAAAIGVGFVALFTGQRTLAWVGAAAVSATASIAAYHTGVERGWWQGPITCTGSEGLGGDLLSTDIVPVVLCDEVAWQFLWLSMASWNFLASLVLVTLWVVAASARSDLFAS